MKDKLVYCLCLVFLASTVTASLIMQDPFEAVSASPDETDGQYLAGECITNDVNNNVYGGYMIGFTTNEYWMGNSDLFKPQLAGLGYSTTNGRDFVSSGGRLTLDLTGEDDSLREVYRHIQDVSGSSVWYFSGLIKATEDTDGTAIVRFEDINGYPGHSPYVWGIGFGFKNGDIVLETRSGSDSVATHTLLSNYVGGETYLIIVKAEFDTNVAYSYSDTISVWVNPEGLTVEEVGTPDLSLEINTVTSNTSLMLDQVRMYVSDFGGGVIDIDELRMGFLWYDVVPSLLDSELLVYDNFSISDNPYDTSSGLPGQSPARTGFIGAWTATSAWWMPYDEGLGYTNMTYALQSEPGSAQVNIPYNYNRYAERSTVDISSNLLYISSLVCFDGDGDGNDLAYAGLMDKGDTSYHAGIQWGFSGTNLMIRCRASSGDDYHIYRIGADSYIENKTYLFVIRMEKNYSGYYDRMTVYVDPEDLRSESANTHDLQVLPANLVDSTVLDEIIMREDYIDSGIFKVDEIRVGTTWEQVVPYISVAPDATIILIQ